MTMHSSVEGHFDAEAATYDYWKEKNWYYYNALKAIAKEYTLGARSVLDAGCGTGGITATLSAPRTVGVDISSEMIARAQKRYTGREGLTFVAADISSYSPHEVFERILFFDVIEHSEKPKETIDTMARLLAPEGLLVVTMANPLWEPILLLAEKLGMKMPEGPHDRISARALISLAGEAGLTMVKRDHKLIFPKHIPLFSYCMNEYIGRLPLVRRLSVIEVFIFAHTGSTPHTQGEKI